MALKSKSMDLVRNDVPVNSVVSGELVRVNLNVPKNVRTAWKTAALQLDLSLSELINEAMSTYLDTHKSK